MSHSERDWPHDCGWPETTCHHHPKDPRVRILVDGTSPLAVATAPTEVGALLLKQLHAPCVYVLTGDPRGDDSRPRAYIGKSGRMPARMGDHRRAPRLAPRSITVITTAASLARVAGAGTSAPDFPLDGDHVEALERALHLEAARAGYYDVLSSPPGLAGKRPALIRKVDSWIPALRLPLIAAGCLILERAADEFCGTGDDEAVEVTPPRSGYAISFPPDLAAQPDAERHELSRRGARATAVTSQGWTVLMPGSLLAPTTIPSCQPGLIAKRTELLAKGLLVLRGDRLEVVRALALPSLVNTGRLVTGTNIPKSAWRQSQHKARTNFWKDRS